MDWTVVGALSELVGAIAVVASLLYVAVQIRQNTTAIRSSTIQAIADQANDLNIALATSEQLPRLMAAMFEDGIGRSDVNAEDRWRLGMTVIAGLRRLENVFLQVRAGVMDNQAFDRIGFEFYRTRFARETWATVRAAFDPDFARFFDTLLDRVPGTGDTKR